MIAMLATSLSQNGNTLNHSFTQKTLPKHRQNMFPNETIDQAG